MLLNFNVCVHTESLQSYLTLCNPMDCTCQASMSTEFSRQEYWSELPCPPLGDLPDSGIKTESLNVSYTISII